MGVLITPMVLAHPLHPIKSRSRNKHRNLWVGWYVSSWRPWFWPMHSIYHIHTTHYSRILTNQNILFLRDIHTNSWYGHDDVLHDLILCGSRCTFSCMFQYSLCHGMVNWYLWHCTLISSTHNRIANRTGFWVYVVIVLNVIRYCCHHFLDRIIFHHDFHHESCDYHWEFYGH